MRNILITTDGSVRAERAFRFLLENFKDRECNVYVYYFMKPGEHELEAERFLKRAEEILAEGGFKQIKYIKKTVITGVGKEILNEAKERKIDLIIISGYGADHAKPGDIGETVLETVKWAECDVIVVKKD